VVNLAGIVLCPSGCGTFPHSFCPQKLVGYSRVEAAGIESIAALRKSASSFKSVSCRELAIECCSAGLDFLAACLPALRCVTKFCHVERDSRTKGFIRAVFSLDFHLPI
jgi:hypothetical protein